MVIESKGYPFLCSGKDCPVNQKHKRKTEDE